jgi:hypothetical protein
MDFQSVGDRPIDGLEVRRNLRISCDNALDQFRLIAHSIHMLPGSPGGLKSGVTSSYLDRDFRAWNRGSDMASASNSLQRS